MQSILFFGSCEFSVVSLKALLKRQQYANKVIEVVTPPDNVSRSNHGSVALSGKVPLKIFAEQCNLQVHHPEPYKDGAKSVTVRTLQRSFDFGVVVSFGYMLSRDILSQFKCGALNVHPSLLPLYRGAAPIQHQIIDGVEDGGVSIISLDPNRFDTGNIYKQTRVRLPKNQSYKVVMLELARQGASDLVDVLNTYDHYKQLSTAQSHQQASNAPKIFKKDALINWSQMSAMDIYRRHLAISHHYNLFTHYNGMQLSFGDLSHPEIASKEAQQLYKDQQMTAPGQFRYSTLTGSLYIKCRDGWLGVLQVSNASSVYGALQAIKAINNNKVNQFD